MGGQSFIIPRKKGVSIYSFASYYNCFCCALVILFGLVDLIGSYVDFDLWGGFMGVELPDIVWQFSSYAEIGIGYLIISLGSDEIEEE